MSSCDSCPEALCEVLEALIFRFELTLPTVKQIAANFKTQMAAGLSGRPCTLKMLPAFVDRPTGSEKGTFLALDFGGTNVRLMLVDLLGQGRYNMARTCSFPLRDSLGTYDYTAESTSGEELFDFIAGRVRDFIDNDRVYKLGHTFSFPSRQLGMNEACLICWTKEIRTCQVEGEDINKLLSEALHRRRAANVKPIVILNDTVSTLLAAAYSDGDCDIGSICGTGHNTCYLERQVKGQCPMIINIESGNFNELPFTIYDDRLDSMSDRPGEQRLEKMVGGYYLGEIVRLAVLDLAEEGGVQIQVDDDSLLRMPYSLKTEHISRFLADQSPGFDDINAWCREFLQVGTSDLSLRTALKTISGSVAKRAACLAAATYAGILSHIDEPHICHTIAIDGSLYQKLPGFSDNIAKMIRDVVPEGGRTIRVVAAKDASGLGAAVAAAVADTR